MKRFALVLLMAMFSSSVALAGVTVRYYNKDSRNYEWKAVCSGSHYTAKFGSSRTASTTIQGSGPCEVHTPNGRVTLRNGDRIEIKNARISKK